MQSKPQRPPWGQRKVVIVGRWWCNMAPGVFGVQHFSFKKMPDLTYFNQNIQ